MHYIVTGASGIWLNCDEDGGDKIVEDLFSRRAWDYGDIDRRMGSNREAYFQSICLKIKWPGFSGDKPESYFPTHSSPEMPSTDKVAGLDTFLEDDDISWMTKEVSIGTRF